MIFHAKANSILRSFSKAIIATITIGSAAHAQPAYEGWGLDGWAWNQDKDGTFTTSGASTCALISIGIYDFYYQGEDFDEFSGGYNIFGFKTNTGTCRDTPSLIDGEPDYIDITRYCRFPNPSGGYVYEYGTCTPRPEVASCVGSGSEDHRRGNPTDVRTLTKVENASDWVSSIDSRFRIDRQYRSDLMHLNSHQVASSYPNNPGLFAGVWRFPFNEHGRRNNSRNAYQVYKADGSLLYYEGFRDYSSGTFSGMLTSNPYQMEGYGYDARILHDGKGNATFFSKLPGQNPQQMHSIQYRYADGYSIWIERASDQHIEAIYDNKGQRAEITYVTEINATIGVKVASEINVDVDYDGTTFSPEYKIAYSYIGNDKTVHPILSEVEFFDLATGYSEVTARYGYKQALPPALTSIQDGRLDASGQPFDWATFSYLHNPDPKEMVIDVTNTSHFGGADAYSFWGSGVTNALGHTTVYALDEVLAQKQIVGVNGVATPNCLATSKSVSYQPGPGEPEGFVYERVERNGAVTRYTRNDRGLVLTKTEDATGLDPRVTTYTWHADYRVPLTRSTEELLETFTYNFDEYKRVNLATYTQTDNLLTSPTFGQSRTWTYNYTKAALGLELLTSVDGPGLISQGVDDVTRYSYDDKGSLTAVVDPNGLVTNFLSLNKMGQPTLVKGADGVEWGIGYDHRGRTTSVTLDPNGPSPKTSSFTYDVIGQVLSSTNMLGHTTTYEYDEARRLVSVVNPAGDVATFEYDLMGNQTRVAYSDGSGPDTFFEETEYDELGRLLKTIGAVGQEWEFSHDVEDNLDLITDPTSLQISHTFDALNRITDTVDRAGYTTSQDHNEADQVTEYTDPRVIDTDFTYNGFGEMLTELSQDRGTITYTYNNRGLATSMTDGNGVVTNYEYDDGGRLTARRFPSDPTLDETFTYLADVTTYQDGYTTQSAGATNLIVNGNFEDDTNGFGQDTTPIGWTKTGDNSGVISSFSKRTIQDYSFALNGWSSVGGQTLRQTIPTIVGQTYELNFVAGAYYNSFTGNLVIEADGVSLGQYSASQIGRNLKPFSLNFTATGTQTEIVFKFDATGSGQVDLDNISVFDPSTNLVVNGHFENVTNGGWGKKKTPLGWTKTGHASGVLAGTADRTTDGFSFALGGWSVFGGHTLRQTITTVQGQLYSMSFEAGAFENNIDGYMKLTVGGVTYAELDANALGTSLAPYSFLFTALSNQTEIVFEGVDNEHGDIDIDSVIVAEAVPNMVQGSTNGRLSQITDSSGSTARTYANDTGFINSETRTIEGQAYQVQYDIDAEGNLKTLTYPSGTVVRYTHDGMDRVTRVEVDLGAGFVDVVAAGASYLPNGPLTSMTYGDGAVFTATYDQSYRLTGLEDDLSGTKLRDIALGWTSRDNLASVTNNLDALDNRTFDYTAREFLKDANGPWGELDYTYDSVGNRLSQLLTVSGAATTDTYTYPATSNRLQSVAGGQTRAFTYDAAGNVTYDARSGVGYGYGYNAANRMSDMSISGVVQAEYDYNALGQQVVRRLTAGGQTIHSVHDGDGNRLAEYDYDDVALTSTLLREYIWMNGEAVGVIEGGMLYFVRSDHIGRPVFATNTLGLKVWEASYLPFGGVHTSSGTAINLRFPGQWFQSEAGLHQNWMRDYDPTTGRYVQADPYGLIDGPSIYGYAAQNPGKYTDPTGEFIPVVAWAGRAALACWRNPKCRAGAAAALGMVLDYAQDEGCYTADDFILSMIANANPFGKALRALPKPPTGAGKVPRSQRDKKRFFTPKERETKRAEQDNRCANCGTEIDATNSRGHHIKRHADGGRSVPENHAEVCKDCHRKLHKR